MHPVAWLTVLVAAGTAAITLLALAYRRLHCKNASATPIGRAKQQFHVQRERLEAKFVQLAAAQVRPDAPQLADCLFDDDVSYVRNRTNGQLSAFVAVTIATEGVTAPLITGANVVQNLQAGTAVFRFDYDHWETDGRALLNLSPNEAAARFCDKFEIVEQEPARHS